ncbi:hypothetical protein SDD30_16855 [Moorella naiadis]|uniref:hypothetical protein n=1 Tax=Moorella naiadis (nom. illeg.) TaxID=3093670 RepID=UPI003D9CBBA9
MKTKIFERSFDEIKDIARKTGKPVLAAVYGYREIDEYPDLTWLKTVQAEDGSIISSCRYSNEDIKEYGLEQVQRWIDEDHERLESYGDTWWMEGVRAAAEIYILAGDSFIIQLIQTPGLWGIESDSEEAYFKEVFSGEVTVLRGMLEKLNVAGLEILEKPLKYLGDVIEPAETPATCYTD